MTEGEELVFRGVPSFAPEILRRVKLADAMKAKKLREALQQMAEEGVVQVFLPHDGASAIVGVVGALQLDVLVERLNAEYGLPVSFEQSRFEVCRWVLQRGPARTRKIRRRLSLLDRRRSRRRAGVHGEFGLQPALRAGELAEDRVLRREGLSAEGGVRRRGVNKRSQGKSVIPANAGTQMKGDAAWGSGSPRSRGDDMGRLHLFYDPPLVFQRDRPCPSSSPVRLALAGLTHGHVDTFYRSPRTNIELVGVSEPDAALREAYRRQHGLSANLFFADIGDMLDAAKPDAVAAFGSIYEHLEVVEAAAPRGVHVMVEKPLAVSVAHATRMAELARRHGIHSSPITRRPGTRRPTGRSPWSPRRTRIGALRKLVIHDGHRGPKKIGCRPEFLHWLTDPVQNGAGALVDFGCYGANLATRLIGAPPVAVTAVARQFKPDLYPKVDDDATIIVDYANAQAIIQASWNWAVSRKDVELYGERGYIVAADGSTLKTRAGDKDEEKVAQLPPLAAPNDDPFVHLASVVRGETKLAADDLAGLDNNLIVVRILELAKRSAAEGRRIAWG